MPLFFCIRFLRTTSSTGVETTPESHQRGHCQQSMFALNSHAAPSHASGGALGPKAHTSDVVGHGPVGGERHVRHVRPDRY